MNNDLKSSLTALAREAGFAECAFASLAPVTQNTTMHPQAQTLNSDLRTVMPDAKCIMLTTMPYQPFEACSNQAYVDSYYLSSNRAHEAAAQLAQRIEETLHIGALASPPVFIKPLAARCGLGEFGRNALISVGKYGTRVSIHAIALNVSVEVQSECEKQFSSMCTNCSACVKACPVHALDGSGNVDITRCLRAQAEGDPFPEPLREKLGGGLLGCDLCQRVCPRNASVKSVQPPAALTDALALDKLLLGQYKPLIPLLGKNNARRQRLTARALIAAANLGKKELLPLIEPLTECQESQMVRDHAQWAKSRLV